jgi:hypothetical protein
MHVFAVTGIPPPARFLQLQKKDLGSMPSTFSQQILKERQKTSSIFQGGEQQICQPVGVVASNPSSVNFLLMTNIGDSDICLP